MSSTALRIQRESEWLREALGLAKSVTPFPWQVRLLREFLKPEPSVRALDIPTGLGKTAVMSVWLVARALGAQRLPRRLVYVVDRRAVVDQASEVALQLRHWVDSNAEVKHALDLGKRSLPISTLRGQHVDNREWLEDPACPAIVVGTVDMVGSRLLFEGYGVSRKMRPYHAGLLGADTLVALDEAHLVPPFEKLLESISNGAATLGPRDAQRELVPAFKLLSLSATGRSHRGPSFGLNDDDLAHDAVSARLRARKRLRIAKLEGELPDALARGAWELAQKSSLPIRCIVFCHRRDDALKVSSRLAALAKDDKKNGVGTVEMDHGLLVGGRRVFEREQAMARLKELGFIAGSKAERQRHAFVIATSAGEVGVDLDADHMVSDLVAWERMVQRLGRVNRRGEGDAQVVVIAEPPPEPKKGVAEAMKRLEANKYPKEAKRKKDVETVAAFEKEQGFTAAWPKPLRRLPEVDGAIDASPGAIRDLKLRSEKDPKLKALLDAATTPAPLRPALTRPLVDAWSMTALREHTGRPEIAPWLRGWIEDEDPQTSVLWRTHLPTRSSSTPDGDVEAFFEAAPPHASELLETETYRVVDWLLARAEALTKTREEAGRVKPQEVIAFALSPAGEIRWRVTFRDLLDAGDEKFAKDRLAREIRGATLAVDARLGGLTDGLLDGESPDETSLPTADGETWLAGDPPPVRFRVTPVDAGQTPVPSSIWTERLRFTLAASEDGEPTRWLSVEKWRHDGATEEDRSAGRRQLLKEHQEWTEERARSLAARLQLPREYSEMLAVAGRLHDEGKRASRWQRAFSAPADGPWAKTRGPMRTALLDGYRHEFGSLPIAERDPILLVLPPNLRELALHLIAAHHGFARPIISMSGCEDAPPSALEERARVVASRFVRLQKEWGPWGLAWWESLLRAADQQASRDNDKAGEAS